MKPTNEELRAAIEWAMKPCNKQEDAQEAGAILRAHLETFDGIDYKHHLLNLLARIHMDGGHYTERVGVSKSVEDADISVAEMIHSEPQTAEERAFLEAAEALGEHRKQKPVAAGDTTWWHHAHGRYVDGLDDAYRALVAKRDGK